MKDFKRERTRETEEDLRGQSVTQQQQEEKIADRDEQRGNSENYNDDEYDSYSPWG